MTFSLFHFCLLCVVSGLFQSREKGKGMFQHRANIEKALAFLRRKSVRHALSTHSLNSMFIAPDWGVGTEYGNNHSPCPLTDQTGQYQRS